MAFDDKIKKQEGRDRRCPTIQQLTTLIPDGPTRISARCPILSKSNSSQDDSQTPLKNASEAEVKKIFKPNFERAVTRSVRRCGTSCVTRRSHPLPPSSVSETKSEWDESKFDGRLLSASPSPPRLTRAVRSNDTLSPQMMAALDLIKSQDDDVDDWIDRRLNVRSRESSYEMPKLERFLDESTLPHITKDKESEGSLNSGSVNTLSIQTSVLENSLVHERKPAINQRKMGRKKCRGRNPYRRPLKKTTKLKIDNSEPPKVPLDFVNAGFYIFDEARDILREEDLLREVGLYPLIYKDEIHIAIPRRCGKTILVPRFIPWIITNFLQGEAIHYSWKKAHDIHHASYMRQRSGDNLEESVGQMDPNSMDVEKDKSSGKSTLSCSSKDPSLRLQGTTDKPQVEHINFRDMDKAERVEFLLKRVVPVEGRKSVQCSPKGLELVTSLRRSEVGHRKKEQLELVKGERPQELGDDLETQEMDNFSKQGKVGIESEDEDEDDLPDSRHPNILEDKEMERGNWTQGGNTDSSSEGRIFYDLTISSSTSPASDSSGTSSEVQFLGYYDPNDDKRVKI